MKKPLVSIGIPTYNRPEGLKRTLEKIVNQTYPYLEIIVSDNGSNTNETELVINEFVKSDNRIKYFRQEVNKGLIFNFHFVLARASSNYFMWATDDDYFENLDLVEILVNSAQENILTFTNYNFIFDNVLTPNYFTPIYGFCENRVEYIRAFCSTGAGHPSCGMFNLSLLKQSGITLSLQEDLSYHMEGMLLHRIFNTGKVKYVDEAIINFNASSRASKSIIPKKRTGDFLIYTKRVLFFYTFRASHSLHDRLKLLKINLSLHYNYYINDLGGKRYGVHKISLFVFLSRVLSSKLEVR
jgi:glycosyltransferase involved in cell wall biosynthesis